MADGENKAVLFEVVEGHIALVTLNRPDKRNAVNGDIAQGLDAAVKRVESDNEIRVAVLTSCLETVFCAGADLSAVSSGTGAQMQTADGGFAGYVNAKRTKPWIAAVRGAALAGGCEIVLASDMVVASEDARFGIPEVKRGLLAGAGGLYRLPRALPRNIAIELAVTGDPIDARRAHAYGLVNRLAPLSETVEAALQLAREIVVNAPLSVSRSLQISRQADDLDETQLLELTRSLMEKTMQSEDAKEGPRAFLEKRPARWTGR